ncbi:tektin family protein [Paraburkholderia adhaesiva]|uniref:tektin family protein n=1 Tax=Paraburkholderia adhaesiva TaxID=2883244 RepID=UPI001F3262B8|nr:tektin family protein [Paraburkholderia adhaesiva]
MPAPSQEGVTGYFSDGDEELGLDGTYVPATWMNGIQEEVAAVIEAATLVLSASDNTQLLQALKKLFAAADRIPWEVIVDTPDTLEGYGITNAVEQGGGVQQGTNKIYIGWRPDGSGLAATVDKTDLGTIVFEAELQTNVKNLTQQITALQQALDAAVTAMQQSLAQTENSLQEEIDGKQPTGNYVQGADGHTYALSWADPIPHLLVDGQDEGPVYCQSWFQPMSLGGIGNTIIVDGNVPAGTTISGATVRGGPTLGGTWMGCGHFSSGSDNFSLVVRVE